MSDERRVDRQGIFIDREVAEAVAIEEELDSSVVGPYRFPDPRRRRIAGVIYLVTAGAVAVVAHWAPAAAIALLGAWHLASAWPLALDQEGALARAAPEVAFPVGHASAAVTFHGWRSRPRWAVILYSATSPPDRRALVTVDAVSGEVIGPPYVEDL